MYRLLCNVLSAAKIMQHKIIAQNNLFKANQIADGKILRYVIHETFAMNGLLSAFQVWGVIYLRYQCSDRCSDIQCSWRKPNNFQISSNKLMDFGAKIESLYDANGNAYHNSIHAADVCQSLNYIFRQNCVMNRVYKWPLFDFNSSDEFHPHSTSYDLV